MNSAIRLVFDEHGEVGEYELRPDPKLALVKGGWQALDLVSLASAPPQPPEVAKLFYFGKRYLVSGEFESGKTWLLVAGAVNELQPDMASSGSTRTRWVRPLCSNDSGRSRMPDEMIAAHLLYVRSEQPADENTVAGLCELSSSETCGWRWSTASTRASRGTGTTSTRRRTLSATSSCSPTRSAAKGSLSSPPRSSRAGRERLSWHSLRHSFASMLATDLELPATTLARLTGHTDAGFTLRVYARDARDEQAVVDDVLERTRMAGIAS